MKPKKLLKDLNLLDRFLFAEAMEDPDNLRILLEIILGKEIVINSTFPPIKSVQMPENTGKIGL